MNDNLFPCPCCSKPSLDKKPPGTFEICGVCGWQDDPVQYKDPDYAGGANKMSLNEARRYYAAHGRLNQN